jgi:hypothetical protein
VSSNYRFAGPFIVRLAGLALAGVGVLVLVLTVLAVTLVRHDIARPGVLIGLTVALLMALCAVAAVRRAVVVRLDDRGYQVRLVRGAGVHRAGWKEVEDVAATRVAGDRCVVLRLRDGRTTTIPVDLLAGSSDDFVRDLQQHLNRGHGYRPLAGPGR